jgi:sugar-phosphatase
MKYGEKMTLLVNGIECDAVLFDLDGVLIDSSTCIQRHWQEWADQHDLDVNLIMQQAHGMRTIETIRRVAPHLDAAREEALYTANEVRDTSGVVMIEGASQVLSTLPANAWGIVTSCSLDLAKARLNAVGLPLPGVLVTSDDVSQGKPDPQPYLVGARRLGVPAERCVVVEDAPSGIAAGKKAGMRVIAIASTLVPEALHENGADIVIERLVDLDIGQKPG